MKVPQFNLSRVVGRIEDDLWPRWRRLVAATAFVGGSEVEAFESDFSDYLGAIGCVGVANGTDALELSLRALELAPGDEVIVPSFTFFATAETVSAVGATPRFADIDPVSFCLDPDAVEALITPRTRALVPVHLFGHAAEMDRLRALANTHGLKILEDAAQAIGAWLSRPGPGS